MTHPSPRRRRTLTRHGLRKLCLAAVLAALYASGALAEPLYRWMDAEGLLHFSDHPPPADARWAEQFNAPSYAAPTLAADEDPYSILNQVKRLEEYRQNLARERREQAQQEREYRLREQELEARRQAEQQVPAGTPVYVYPRPIYPRPPVHRPDWQRQRRGPTTLWPPDHPAYRPHLRRPNALSY